jgi:beta-lactamase superfamily II metal-dependent hydrolase
VDVGQGTSNVILLGGGRAIVIDCGPSSTNVPLQLLKRYIHTIEALVISHNDEDHDGGAARIIGAYPKAIEQVFFLADRPSHLIRTLSLVKREIAANRLLRSPVRLEAKDLLQTIYADPTSHLRLVVYYPTFAENLAAEDMGSRRANATSAVLALFCGSRKVVFSGDATMDAWESIATRLTRESPIPCDIMTVPHHGGHLVPKKASETVSEYQSMEKAAMNRLYSRIVQPKFAVVSVGSSNCFGRDIHPLPSTISALRELGIEVLCTQMTPHCTDDLEAIRPGILLPITPSRSTPTPRCTQSGRSKDVACAGSIVAEVTADRVAVSRWPVHQQALQEAIRASRVHPLCQSGGKTKAQHKYSAPQN